MDSVGKGQARDSAFETSAKVVLVRGAEGSAGQEDMTVGEVRLGCPLGWPSRAGWPGLVAAVFADPGRGLET